ncbi:cytochrome c oxidase assembly protein [Actimicrobium sp. GrIS 1.19]|uniref:cytochrome c oxidase assembly protein n=1 Tax=Actimicrobium sp. GrIS 1.19 TaxID=3071708 RepID=UPI003FA34D82
MSTGESPETARKIANRLNAQMFGKLILIAVLMFGFGYALVPMYRKICELTGSNVLSTQESTAAPAASNTQIDTSRYVTVEFDGNAQGPWRFRPTVSSVRVHPGELTHIVYEVVNKQSRVINAQAIPSYAPQEAAGYFKKLECFCFKQQTLGPNEARQMPVAFYVDANLPKNVTTITLSYTFFEVGLPGKTASQ